MRALPAEGPGWGLVPLPSRRVARWAARITRVSRRIRAQTSGKRWMEWPGNSAIPHHGRAKTDALSPFPIPHDAPHG